MGLASALSTALTGLTAAETQIDVVGNNLANSQTVGFKESEVTFTTQFLQTLSLGAAPTPISGGTNPRQTGLGVEVAEVSPDFTQGTIQTSSSPSDVALQCDGFFMVQGTGGERLYTRSGIFRTNSQNELVTVNGDRLLGHGVDSEFQLQTTSLVPLTVPLGSVRVAQATRNVVLEGSLSPTGAIADTAQVVDSAILGDGSIPRPDTETAGSSATLAPAPSVLGITPTTIDGGGALTENATYRYRFAFVDVNGTESGVSDEVQVTIPAGNGLDDDQISIAALPTSGGEYAGVNIYRTAENGTDFFLLAENQTDGAAFTDTGATALDTSRPLDEGTLNGNYSYVVTFARAGDVESRPSPLVGPVNVTGGRIHLRNLPQPPVPVGDEFPAYDKVRIYRNLASDSSTYYLVDEINPGEDYTDSRSDSIVSANPTVDLDGPKINSNTLLTDVTQRDELTFQQVFQLGELEFTPRKGGRSLTTQSFTVTADSTVQDLLDFVRDSSGIQRGADDPANPIPSSINTIPNDNSALAPGASITQDGRLRIVSNNGVDSAVTVGLSSMVLTESDGTISSPNLGFSTSQEAAGQSAAADFLVYDSLGVPINVRVTAVMEARDGSATTYRWFADSSGNDPVTGIDISVGTGLITFDGEGNFINSTNSLVSVDRRNSPAVSPLDFNLDFTAISGLSASQSTLNASRQDGSAAGTLASFSIGEDGVIRGAFNNGVARTLGQIRLSRFANSEGLEQRGQNLFSEGANSGLPIEGNPGENGTGTLVAGAVELSNTDIGQNLIELVLATTQYRGNTRVVNAAQQLLEELLNLRR